MKWIRNKDKILMSFENKVVRVRINKSFYYYVKSHDHPFSSLSVSIHRKYKEIQGKRLLITYRSLAYEIALHYYAYLFFILLKRLLIKISASILRPMINLCEYMIVHCKTIDCGERSVDNNRFVFDYLSTPKKKYFKIIHRFVHFFRRQLHRA